MRSKFLIVALLLSSSVVELDAAFFVPPDPQSDTRKSFHFYPPGDLGQYHFHKGSKGSSNIRSASSSASSEGSPHITTITTGNDDRKKKNDDDDGMGR
jgi:hypothetical protein